MGGLPEDSPRNDKSWRDCGWHGSRRPGQWCAVHGTTVFKGCPLKKGWCFSRDLRGQEQDQGMNLQVMQILYQYKLVFKA